MTLTHSEKALLLKALADADREIEEHHYYYEDGDEEDFEEDVVLSNLSVGDEIDRKQLIKKIGQIESIPPKV